MSAIKVNQPSKSLVFDYESYPYIIERILFFSTNATLVAWRGTCRRMRELTNSHLDTYLTICPRAPFEKHRHQPPFEKFRHHCAILLWHMSCELRDHSQSLGLLSELGRDVGAVRILDVGMARDWWRCILGEASSLCKHLPNLELVRVHDSQVIPEEMEYRKLPAAHTVHFTPTAPQDGRKLQANAAPFAGGNVFINIRYTLNKESKEDAKKRVGSGDDSDEEYESDREEQESWVSYLDVEKKSDSEFYFFLTSSESDLDTTTTSRLSDYPSPTKTWQDCLFAILPWVSVELLHHSRATFVFVGDPATAQNRQVGQRSQITEREKTLVALYLTTGFGKEKSSTGYGRPRCEPGWMEEVVRMYDEHIRFMTFEEMEEVLGEEMYRLVMEP